MNQATPVRLGIAFVVALALLIGGLSHAFADGQGVISGKVQNKTQGGAPVAGVEVSLTVMAHQAPGPTQTTTTDSEGKFRFDNLTTAANFAYSVGLKYQGTSFGSDGVIVFQSGETAKTADITVYDTTDQSDALVIERAHIILGQPTEDQTIPVMEILILNNNSDRAIVSGGAQRPTIDVPLPAEARGIQLADEVSAGAVETPEGFAYLDTVLPGQNEMLYSYELPYQSGTFDFSRSFRYPAQQVTLLAPESGFKVSSAQLVPQEPRNINGQSYVNLRGENVSSGSVVNIHIEGLRVPSPLSALLDKLGWAQPAIIGLVVVGALAFVLLRRRQRDSGDEDELEGYDSAGDDSFADDELDDDDLDQDEDYEVEEQTPRRR